MSRFILLAETIASCVKPQPSGLPSALSEAQQMYNSMISAMIRILTLIVRGVSPVTNSNFEKIDENPGLEERYDDFSTTFAMITAIIMGNVKLDSTTRKPSPPTGLFVYHPSLSNGNSCPYSTIPARSSGSRDYRRIRGALQRFPRTYSTALDHGSRRQPDS